MRHIRTIFCGVALAMLVDHPLVAEILASRARSISENPAEEAVVIVAHGPGRDDENRRWLVGMKTLANMIGQKERFHSIDVLTLRDDAPKPIRDQATADLRAVVTKRRAEGRRVLIVPLLVSFGGVERGLRERLADLPYTMPKAALVPDDRLVTWVLTAAEANGSAGAKGEVGVTCYYVAIGSSHTLCRVVGVTSIL